MHHPQEGWQRSHLTLRSFYTLISSPLYHENLRIPKDAYTSLTRDTHRPPPLSPFPSSIILVIIAFGPRFDGLYIFTIIT